MAKTAIRIFLAIVLGNLLGYSVFRLAAWAAPQWWQSAAKPIPLGLLMLMIGLTAISFATPPVIVSALAARAAGRCEAGVGLAASLWGLTARQWWPERVPLLPPESWVAPMMLIFLSGLMGGWLAGGGPADSGQSGRCASPES